ncbi:NAD(P)-dependent alcohol dehydrogenase [Pseudovibrio sp. Alg231-02]|uniref:NAD(P)-dependent alcohol dehydrogenase n=1 Tax=Pseudovibrio sp. Alg231-02 TaxID=1922223 RepID=UPI000D54AF09|nr:NAD(P)-dependent alcohol dehydrogenase [Pseudovibrio sp. Alg231-02]
MKEQLESSVTYHNTTKVSAIALTKQPQIGQVANELKLLTLPVPRPAKNQVAIQLIASSMHIDEIYAAQGTALGRFYAPKNISVNNPHIMGSSVSGIVVAIGSSIKQFKLGDEVVVIPNESGENGSWATYRCVSARYVMLKPSNMSHVAAAAIMLSACVAWGALRTANIKAGERCLVIGASGAIGSVLVQVLKAKSAYVTGVCSAANAKLVRTLGADNTLDYQSTEFTAEKANTFDKVFDLVGGLRNEAAAYRWLKLGGKFITVVGPVQYLGERKLSRKEFFQSVCHVMWRSISTIFRGPRYKFCATLPRHVAQDAMQFASEHKIHSPIEMEVPFNLKRIQDAIGVLTSHRTRGRIVIRFENSELPENPENRAESSIEESPLSQCNGH